MKRLSGKVDRDSVLLVISLIVVLYFWLDHITGN